MGKLSVLSAGAYRGFSVTKRSARYPMPAWPNVVAACVIEMIIVPVDVESPIEEAYAERNIFGRKKTWPSEILEKVRAKNGALKNAVLSSF